MTTKLVIVDYGMGNLWSVASAFRYLGIEPVISDDPKIVAKADRVILPGVGSYYNAMRLLKERGLFDALGEAILIRKRNILGICLGMQLLAKSGTEDGECDGLGFIPGKVERFNSNELGTLKIPHVGFNSVTPALGSRLFRGFNSETDFYFVHSYRLLTDHSYKKVSSSKYGIDFIAACEHDNIYATQFHPEKSQTNGLRLLQNFLTI